MDSVSLENGSNARTTKQRTADKTKTKSGRTKKTGAAADGGNGQKIATQVSNLYPMAVLSYFRVYFSTAKGCNVSE